MDLYTDNPDAIVFVNGKSTGKTVQEMDPFGPVKLDGSVEIYAQKEFVTGVRKSTPVVIDENTYDINLYIGYDDYDEQYDIETKRTEELRAMAEEEQAIMDTIYNHYRRISNDDFESAYQLFSKNMKKKFDVDGWAKGLEPNLRDDVTTIDVEEIDGNKAVAYIEMTSYDDNGDGTVTAKNGKELESRQRRRTVEAG